MRTGITFQGFERVNKKAICKTNQHPSGKIMPKTFLKIILGLLDNVVCCMRSKLLHANALMQIAVVSFRLHQLVVMPPLMGNDVAHIKGKLLNFGLLF